MSGDTRMFKVNHFPFHTTHARIPADKAGRVMDGIHGTWHIVQFFSFRFVIMWPAKTPEPP